MHQRTIDESQLYATLTALAIAAAFSKEGDQMLKRLGKGAEGIDEKTDRAARHMATLGAHEIARQKRGGGQDGPDGR